MSDRKLTGEHHAIVALADMHLRMTALAERAVVALHMHRHAGINKPGFDDCREGLCAEWHAINSLPSTAKGK